jgi:uncharacterized protein (TIGR03086 family)
MTDIAELHARALDATGRIVDGVAADRWHAATPCADWDARGLVNHRVAGNLWAAELAAGGTIEGAGSRLDGDLLSDDPAAAYAASASAAAAVFRRPGALDAPCAVSYGPVPGSVYAGHRFLDVLVHGWDLAVATGQDYALDPALMQRASRSSSRSWMPSAAPALSPQRWRSRRMPARRPDSLRCSAERAERPTARPQPAPNREICVPSPAHSDPSRSSTESAIRNPSQRSAWPRLADCDSR